MINSPTASMHGIPKYSANTLSSPTKHANPSFIEFYASKYKEIRSYFLGMLLTLKALWSIMARASSNVIMVIPGFMDSSG